MTQIDDAETKTNINLVSKMYGTAWTNDLELKFEKLIFSLTPTFIILVPESRMDNPYVIALTKEGEDILKKKGPLTEINGS